MCTAFLEREGLFIKSNYRHFFTEWKMKYYQMKSYFWARGNIISSMASKPINNRWFRTGSQPDWKIMYSIELQTIFYEYQNENHKNKTKPVLLARAFGYSRLTKLITFHFDIQEKLAIIRCKKKIF